MQKALIWEPERGSPENTIEEDLPNLLVSQREDVIQIEERFKVGKGRMITNGTGTGKTSIGLGVIKRFTLKGKYKVIILVPTDDKAKDWIEEGLERVNLTITQLKDIKDRGVNIRVTTYANFYQNYAILLEEFDLIVYDESHYLLQNGQGKETSTFLQHKMLCSLPSVLDKRGSFIVGEMPHSSDQPGMLTQKQQHENSLWRKKCREIGTRIFYKTKVLFLSATPFAYIKSIKYCDGLLWDINEVLRENNKGRSYNEGDAWDRFLCKHFGYSMKYNKVTKPSVEVNTGLLEREFFENAKKNNLISTRKLVLDVDYSRHFIKVDTDIGTKLDDFFTLLWDLKSEDANNIRLIYSRHFNYIFFSKIVESAKAKMIIDRIKLHLMIGRKVIVFHSYNNINISHPFLITDIKKYLLKDEAFRERSIKRSLDNFYKAFPEYTEYNLHDLGSVPDIMKKAFNKKVVFYNGTILKKKRKINKELFMSDNSGVDIIVLQSQAGKEGISLHDTTGVYDRVLIDLSLPIRPTEALQKEGRPYRWGGVSNVMYEYPTLQTNRERVAFAETIADRATTVENLAMGNLARDLETAFKTGYENYEDSPPSIAQGRKGKESDKQLSTSLTPYDKALTYYFQRGKVNRRQKEINKNTDFFATPEPLAFKMVEWANTKKDLSWLDPSCGDGSIMRFFPEHTKRVGIEINYNLLSVAKLKVNANIVHRDFMEYKIHNKFDRIIMNPPYGRGGKTAIEHLQKALIHLSKMKSAKLYCIIPQGPSCDKYFNKLIEEDHNLKNFFSYTGQLTLPACTFRKAATTVLTRIVRIESKKDNFLFQDLSLSHITNIKDFFNELNNINF